VTSVCNEVSKALAYVLTLNKKVGLAGMANLKRSGEFQARTMIAETFSHSGKFFQLAARALDCAPSITECEDDRRRSPAIRCKSEQKSIPKKVNLTRFQERTFREYPWEVWNGFDYGRFKAAHR
jgi:hypothetical protein